MKTLTPLLIAVMACSSVFSSASAQADTQNPAAPPGMASPLSHSDSLVLLEAGGAPGSSLPGKTTDTLALIDSLSRADSLSRVHTRVRPFPAVINAVLADFPNDLRHITGELLLAQGEFENYASMVELPGAENCTVTRYHSGDDTTASWQAKMYNSDDFETAAHAYHELYKKLQGCYLRLVDGSMIYLSGVWEPAKEGASFTTSTLRLTTGDWRYKDVKVELELVYLLADWGININIISKKRDDEVGGGVGTGL